MEVRLDGDVVDEDAEEPVEGEHAGVHPVGGEVVAEAGKFLRDQLLQDFLRERRKMRKQKQILLKSLSIVLVKKTFLSKCTSQYLCFLETFSSVAMEMFYKRYWAV